MVPPSGQAADDCKVQRLSLRSGHVDEVRSFGGRYFYPRKFLHPLRRSGRLTARFDLLRLGPLTIGDMQYGADVTLGYGSTPMAYLRHVRLARAHDDLCAADPSCTTVADIAYRWGFLHLGRFAADYRSRYQTTPSRTLQGFS